MYTQKELGNRISSLRKNKQLSQGDLAKRTGINRAYLSGIEKGNKNITFESMVRIAKALDIPLVTLFTFEAPQGLLPHPPPKKIRFFKLGGTWDMIETSQGLQGNGQMDDAAFDIVEQQCGYNETKIANYLDTLFKKCAPLSERIETHLAWANNVGKLIQGQFFSLFSGDSSHYRPALHASVVAHILRSLKQYPNLPILAGVGTDTTDILLSLLDVFLFDSQTNPVIITGANRSRFEKNSDAPNNFYDLGLAAHMNLSPGAYYVFNHTLYTGADIIKIDPREDPKVLEGTITFYAPHDKHLSLGFFEPGWNTTQQSYTGETLKVYKTEEILNAMENVVTVDLGDQNPIQHEIDKMVAKTNKGIIIESHALGNVPTPIRKAAVIGAQQGKLVINVSRCLIGEVNERYSLSLMNANSRELKRSGDLILTGRSLNSLTARAILIRSILNNYNQKETQNLIDQYLKERKLK